MEYASLTHADIQSVSDQTDYRYNARIAASCATAVLPEQAAIWSYPKAKDTYNAFVMNMVSSMLLRVHLSGEVYGWTPKQAEAVKEAISVYKNIRNGIKNSIPFYPVGIPRDGDELMCAAYKNGNTVRMAVWRMEGESCKLTIPLNGKVTDAKILYPSSKNSEINITNYGVCVELYDELSAAVFEITTEE